MAQGREVLLAQERGTFRRSGGNPRGRVREPGETAATRGAGGGAGDRRGRGRAVYREIS